MRPPVVSAGPFPWSLQQPSPSSVAVFPQDLGFLPSAVCPICSAVAWLPLLVVFPAFVVLLQ